MTAAHFAKVPKGRAASNAAELNGLSDGGAKLRECIQSLSLNSAGKTQSQVFDDLCEQLCVVFGEDSSDGQILSSSATPDLVRYLANALRKFHSKGLNGATPDKRARALAGSMMAVASKGAPTKAKLREDEIIRRALNSLNLDLAQGCICREKAESRAVDAAYKVRCRGENGNESAHHKLVRQKRIREELSAILHRHKPAMELLNRFQAER